LRSSNFYRNRHALPSRDHEERSISGVFTHVRRQALLVLAGLLLVHALYAIDPNRAMSQYVRDRWGTEQGFPRGPVYAIAQTSDGYLWIGTDAGLVRFDGWNFRLIKDESGSYTITSVLGLNTSADGSLWIQLQDLTILRYHDGVFENPSSGPGSATGFSAMSRNDRGSVVGWRMDIGAFGFRNNGFQMLAPATDLPRSPVTAIAQTPDGDLWMGTRDAGLFRFGAGKTSSIRNGLPDLKVNCLLPDGARELWVGTDSGIVKWNGSELTGSGLPASFNGVQALAMVRDRDANIWVGTDSRGLLRLNSQGITHLDDTDSAAVTAIFEDREANLWIGSASGLERLRDSAFVTYSLPEGIPSDGTNPVFVDSNNRMWFPPIDGGLMWMKDGKHEHVHNAGLDKDVIYSIAGSRGELWLGRRDGGLTQLRTDQASFGDKTYTHADGLAEDSVYSVYQGRDGTVWAGTLSGGVSKLSNGKFTNYTTADGLASNTVASILETADGTMWFATPSGLSAFSKGRWHTYTTKDGLPSNDLNCLLEDSAGVLWVGTADGLAFRGSKRFQVSAGSTASLREQILGIAEDKSGSIWLATSGHVLRVNRDKFLRGALNDGDVREYGRADGLRGVEGVKRHRSVVTDPAGRIWFSLNRGISLVDPARLTSNSTPAVAHVQAISADGRPISLLTAIHIPGGRQKITFGFAGLSLSIPERVRLRYQLEPFDHGWSEPVATREVAYTNLPPGAYRFRVMASNPDGVWSGNEAAVSFAIEPLFWQTWWFRFCVVAACSLGILALYRFRLRQHTRQLNMRFEERLGERTRIAQELHDTLLQGFLSASMQLHVAVDRLPEDSPSKLPLGRVLDLMRRVVEEGRNAVQGLRSTQTDSLNLEQAFSRIQEELAIEEDVGFRVIVDGQSRPLHPVLRDEVYRIGREALVNAFRHSRANNIEIELEYAPSQLRVLVRDNGCGIESDTLLAGREGHWGLRGMRERADKIGAKLHVWSRPSAGTEVELSIPSHVAFQNQPSGRATRWFFRPDSRKSESASKH
jgi:signal transduction histidine kinase/ligand-binding sensor domain-containing protein